MEMAATDASGKWEWPEIWPVGKGNEWKWQETIAFISTFISLSADRREVQN